jgi:hypothetical protein
MKVKDVDASIERLFTRFPHLCGFSVRDSGGLDVADVSVYPVASEAVRDELLGDIADTLLQLMDEDPGARELICGRTFARTLH